VRLLIGGESLISEFHIRRELQALRLMPGPPTKRARALLRFARKVDLGAQQMAVLSQCFFREGDAVRGARFGEAESRLRAMQEEAREGARAALRTRSRPPDLRHETIDDALRSRESPAVYDPWKVNL